MWAECFGQVSGLLADVGGVGLPKFVDAAGQLLECVTGKVGDGIKRFEIRSQPEVHGPAAATGHDLQSSHVTVVEVGSFFAVEFDTNEKVVEEGGGVGVLEGFVSHDVAPMAGGVADGEEDGFVGGMGCSDGFVTPRPPVHGIVSVLAEVGAAGLKESAVHGCSRTL